MKQGDYVLATKYADGDPGDGFAVGFYDRVLEYPTEVRHMVVDGEGQQFRGNGFRRVKEISHKRGEWLIDHFPEIEAGTRSLWWWVRRKMGKK